MNRGRILIVDDEPEIRRALRIALVACGYEVAQAQSGEDALANIWEPTPQLVLLDLKLPGMGGLDTCRAIRTSLDVPILVISVRGSESEKVKLLDAGADDYIVKPFGISELLARIRAALRRPSTVRAEPAVLIAGNIEIDLKSRRVRCAGQSICLKYKEFEVLRCLIRNTGDIIPHRRLLQAVWGADYSNEFQYLRVIVNRLRKKIEPNPGQPRFIITEPKVGYGFFLPGGSVAEARRIGALVAEVI